MGSGASVADGSERIDENQEVLQADGHHTESEVLKSDYLRSSMLLKNVPKDILTNPRWCNGFKRYISECYIEDISPMMDPATALQLRDLALNFLLFWLDVSDFKIMPDDSAFRTLSAENICEKFFGAGSKSQISLSIPLVEDIMIKRDTDGGPPKDIFDAAESEAFDYLKHEVMPYFLENEGQLGYNYLKKFEDTYRRVRHSLDLTKDNAFNTMTALRKELTQVIMDPLSCRFFKNYLTARGSPELLYFYLDVLDFEDIFVQVKTTNQGSEKSNFRYFLMRANKIYDRHIKLGSPLRGILRSAALQNFVDKLSGPKILDEHLFDELKEDAFNVILFDHFPAFKESPEAKLMQAELSKKEEEKKVNHHTEPSETEDNRKALLEMLNSNTYSKFLQFLREQGHKEILLFWCEVEDFKSIPSSQQAFIQGRQQKIFDKYIKRGAPLEVTLDPVVRAHILQKIDTPGLEIYDWAQCTLFEILLQDDFTLFTKGPLYLEWVKEKKQREKQAAVESPIMSSTRNDIPLMVILSNPVTCTLFKKFAETEFCVEPLLFFMEVEEYKRLPRSEFLKSRSRKIINKFIKENANSPITISQEARQQAIERSLDPSPQTFQLAQQEIMTFMDTVLLTKFRKSEEYPELVRALQEEERQSASNMGRRSIELDLQDLPSDPSVSCDLNGGFRDLLNDQVGVRFFKEFCTIRHCSETILFWLEAEAFKNIPGNDFLIIQARKTISKYISEGAKQQVNIDGATRLKIMAEADNPTRSIFQKAQNEIYRVMQRDAYPPFLHSEQYKRFKELCQEKLANSSNPQRFTFTGTVVSRSPRGSIEKRPTY